MDKYEVVGLLGEGSFGRVYKATKAGTSSVVALKVITKRGKSLKEIKGLRQECEIQRGLHHPNIIQMLDSFETDNEIVVITEFAHKELTVVLSKEGYLPEERAQRIVWDLVSALYYLHSHRVLHRDLKPQNILLDQKNNAKLCDFGFARNMSTGTHVLTSIKGTPLYMAPELVEEHPYDHNADLWSLGCIIYELLVGTPPFCTTSLLHLIKMIRHDQVQFPSFLSELCISFLKGLLQKDPGKRVAWPDLLKHPFVKGHVLVLDDVPSKPLTRPMSIDTLQAKEQQRKDCLNQRALKNSPQCHKVVSMSTSSFDIENNNSSLDEQLSMLNIDSDIGARSCLQSSANSDSETHVDNGHLHFYENTNPIENDEWVVFLLRTIEEVIAGEMTSLSQKSLASIIISPLSNSNVSSKVLGYVANLLSLPFVVTDTSEGALEQIKNIYFDVKVVPNLVYATKLMFQYKCSTNLSTSSTAFAAIDSETQHFIAELSDDDSEALQHIFLLICHLVHLRSEFLKHFCDAVATLNVYNILRDMLSLSKQRVRLVIDLLAILTHILRTLPDRTDVITKILNTDNSEFNVVHLLKSSNPLLRERTCYFVQNLGKKCSEVLKSEWTESVRDILETLIYDSIEDVRNAAEVTVQDLKKLPFYQ
ncbi:hypothetical protein PPYR_11189 [Photinus pyralis]|uniref:non-specific serine/threonine protein kinase n=1 Tax=Photinus pyralis TaxID=7054 RepID=A0A5N4AAJ9_PHOPY|nr:serine/threonine-protein kinase fused [Photinus pyralis]KAB0794350.1 hypothetical protein PPYR_11189 [Photinus pyralis]